MEENQEIKVEEREEKETGEKQEIEEKVKAKKEEYTKILLEVRHARFCCKKVMKKQGRFKVPSEKIENYIANRGFQEETMIDLKDREIEQTAFKRVISWNFGKINTDFCNGKVNLPDAGLLEVKGTSNETNMCGCNILRINKGIEHCKKMIGNLNKLKRSINTEKNNFLNVLLKKSENKYYYKLCFPICLEDLEEIAGKKQRIIDREIAIYKVELDRLKEDKEFWEMLFDSSSKDPLEEKSRRKPVNY